MTHLVKILLFLALVLPLPVIADEAGENNISKSTFKASTPFVTHVWNSASGLIVCLGIISGGVYLLKSRHSDSGQKVKALFVVDSIEVGRKVSISIVRVKEQEFLLAQNDSAFELQPLHETSSQGTEIEIENGESGVDLAYDCANCDL